MLAKLNGYMRAARPRHADVSGEGTRAFRRATPAPSRYYRASRMAEALATMDSLLPEAPDDPFFLEQKAQILYDNGRIADALPLYQQALDLAPTEPLIRMELATAQVQLGRPAAARTRHRAPERGGPPGAEERPRLSTCWRHAYWQRRQRADGDLGQAEECLARGKNEGGQAVRRPRAGGPAGGLAGLAAGPGHPVRRRSGATTTNNKAVILAAAAMAHPAGPR